MNYNVSIKNKLFGRRMVEYRKINPSAPDSENPNYAPYVLSNDQPAPVIMEDIEKLHIKVDATSLEEPVYLTIDSLAQYDLMIEKIQTESSIAWDLAFKNSAANKTPGGPQIPVKNTPIINVSVGDDEPKGRRPRFTVWIIAAAVVSFVLSVLVRDLSEPLWYGLTGVLAASLIGATVYYWVSKKKEPNIQHKNVKS